MNGDPASAEDHLAAIDALVGVSVDNVETQCAFANQEQVAFPLLGDSDRRLSGLFGVLWPLLRVDRRVTFIIGPDGVVEEVIKHAVFTDADRAFIESRPFFFLATADAEGRPDCSYKGGRPGFVRVAGPSTLAFPSYDGNGMFKSLGNILVNPHVGLLFIDFMKGHRLRVHGSAEILTNDPMMGQWPEAQFVVRIAIREVFGNCPRYIHKYQLVERSSYVPRKGSVTPVPDWKKQADVREALAGNDPARRIQGGAGADSGGAGAGNGPGRTTGAETRFAGMVGTPLPPAIGTTGAAATGGAPAAAGTTGTTGTRGTTGTGGTTGTAHV